MIRAAVTFRQHVFDGRAGGAIPRRTNATVAAAPVLSLGQSSEKLTPKMKTAPIKVSLPIKYRITARPREQDIELISLQIRVDSLKRTDERFFVHVRKRSVEHFVIPPRNTLLAIYGKASWAMSCRPYDGVLGSQKVCYFAGAFSRHLSHLQPFGLM